MADITVRLTQEETQRPKVRLTPQDNLLITNYRVFQGSQVKLSDIFDVDIENPQDGDVLQYRAETTTWVASKELIGIKFSGDIILEGGEFD